MSKHNPPDATAHDLAHTNRRIEALERHVKTLTSTVTKQEARLSALEAGGADPGLPAQLDALRQQLSQSASALQAAVAASEALLSQSRKGA